MLDVPGPIALKCNVARVSGPTKSPGPMPRMLVAIPAAVTDANPRSSNSGPAVSLRYCTTAPFPIVTLNPYPRRTSSGARPANTSFTWTAMSNDDPGETVPISASEMLDARAEVTLAASAKDKRQMIRLMFMSSLLDEGPVVRVPDAIVVQRNPAVAVVVHPAVRGGRIFPDRGAEQFLIGRVDAAVVVEVAQQRVESDHDRIVIRCGVRVRAVIGDLRSCALRAAIERFERARLVRVVVPLGHALDTRIHRAVDERVIEVAAL